ncbi:MAG: uroporphyrinogen-III synthase [Caldilineaceae bacterium]|nr:uroporphyrinogen-III synthase [Caldilineaceae bacterium]
MLLDNMINSEERTQANLQGLRVAITRSAEQADLQTRLLREFGAEVVYYPCLDIMPPKNLEALDAGLLDAAAGKYDWLLLTTANTVFMISERMAALGISPAQLAGLRVATFGANTHRALNDKLSPLLDQTPETYAPEDLVAAIDPKAGERFLLPQSSRARPVLANLLLRAGAEVTAVVAYRDVLGKGGDAVPVMLWEGNIDAITFTSEANVHYFAKRLQYEGGSLAMLDHVCVACMGPITEQTARGYGLHVDIVPSLHTAEGLISALAEYLVSKTTH